MELQTDAIGNASIKPGSGALIKIHTIPGFIHAQHCGANTDFVPFPLNFNLSLPIQNAQGKKYSVYPGLPETHEMSILES